MTFETVLSVVMLAASIWAIRFLLPRAIKADDPLALSCAVLMAVCALLMWLLIGEGTRSFSF